VVLRRPADAEEHRKHAAGTDLTNLGKKGLRPKFHSRVTEKISQKIEIKII
jgi:hypothetical protein